MRVLITNGYIVYYFNVVAFKTEIYDDDDENTFIDFNAASLCKDSSSFWHYLFSKDFVQTATP